MAGLGVVVAPPLLLIDDNFRLGFLCESDQQIDGKLVPKKQRESMKSVLFLTYSWLVQSVFDGIDGIDVGSVVPTVISEFCIASNVLRVLLCPMFSYAMQHMQLMQHTQTHSLYSVAAMIMASAILGAE